MGKISVIHVTLRITFLFCCNICERKFFCRPINTYIHMKRNSSRIKHSKMAQNKKLICNMMGIMLISFIPDVIICDFLRHMYYKNDINHEI